jgi:hypothetical protein
MLRTDATSFIVRPSAISFSTSRCRAVKATRASDFAFHKQAELVFGDERSNAGSFLESFADGRFQLFDCGKFQQIARGSGLERFRNHVGFRTHG